MFVVHCNTINLPCIFPALHTAHSFAFQIPFERFSYLVSPFLCPLYIFEPIKSSKIFQCAFATRNSEIKAVTVAY